MRHVVLLMHVSLDGFIAGPNGEMNWIIVDDEIWQDVIALQRSADTALFGRVNYQDFASYWSTAAANPASTPAEVEHGTWLDQSDKVVFSRTLKTTSWQNARIVPDDLAGEVARLKAQPGKDLLLFGGAGIAVAFMRLGLIDEFRLNVDPVVLGSGQSLFGGLQQRLDLTLLDAKKFGSGVVGLHYAVRRG